MTDYDCCKGHTDVGHDPDCPQKRQADYLERIATHLREISHELRKGEDE